MTASAAEVYAVAAVVWDQDSHSEADMAFLDAVNAANKEWADTLNGAKLQFPKDPDIWKVVKRLATRERDQQLARALAELESHDDLVFGLLDAAE